MTSKPISPFRARISSLTCPVMPGCWAPLPAGVCEYGSVGIAPYKAGDLFAPIPSLISK